MTQETLLAVALTVGLRLTWWLSVGGWGLAPLDWEPWRCILP